MRQRAMTGETKIIRNTSGQTFVVTYKNGQNGTKQGTVQWVKTQQIVAFRSLLELIRLLDSAVNVATVPGYGFAG